MRKQETLIERLYDIATAIVNPIVEKHHAMEQFCDYWNKAMEIRDRESLSQGDYKGFLINHLDDLIDDLMMFPGGFQPVNMTQAKIEMILELEERKQELLKEQELQRNRPEKEHGSWQQSLHTSNRKKSFDLLLESAEARRMEKANAKTPNVRERMISSEYVK